MTDTQSKQNATADRLLLTAVGTTAGFGAWLFFEVLLDEIEAERLLMVIAALLLLFFTSLMVAKGPLRFGAALKAAAVIAVVPTALLYWASFRFDNVLDFLETGHPVVAVMAMGFVGLPFLINFLGRQSRWDDYGALFDNAWGIVVRYIVAWTFVAIFWGVIFLSDQLFKIVGLDIIENILDLEPVPYLLTGMMMGLGLAVVHELSDFVSPYILLRLLRLLLPLVLVVVAVFVVAVPVRGISDLFGDLSSATILMAMAIAAITLVTTAIDRAAEDAVEVPFMVLATRLLALLIPILSALAVYAVWLRVDQVGWSPNRLAAATVAGFVLYYGLIYALAVIRRGFWMARIREANVVMALIILAVAAIWLTPIMNPQRISAQNQLARFQAGKTAIADLDLWAIGREWGRAGERILPEFAADDGEDATVVHKMLADLEKYDNRWEYQQNEPTQIDDDQNLLQTLPVLPAGKDIPVSIMVGMNTDAIRQGCAMTTPDGRPGCLAVVADLLPGENGDEVVFFWMIGEAFPAGVEMRGRLGGRGWITLQSRRLQQTDPSDVGGNLIDNLHRDGVIVQPAPLSILKSGKQEFLMVPN